MRWLAGRELEKALGCELGVSRRQLGFIATESSRARNAHLAMCLCCPLAEALKAMTVLLYTL